MLTDTALRNLKPKSLTYKASDRDGMYVTVSPTGTVTYTVNPLRCSAIVTDSCRDVFLLKSIRYVGFSIGGDSPRRT